MDDGRKTFDSEMLSASDRAEVHRRMDPESAAVYRAVLQRMGTNGRSRLAMQLSVMARRLSEDGVRMRHPEYDDRNVKLAAIKLAIGAELFAAAYPGEDVEP
jgi:hypothetical protein